MEEIYEVGGRLDLAITIPDDKARAKSGRVFLDDFCSRHGIPLVKVASINDADAVAAIKQAEIDWMFIIGWSQIARADALAAPKLGALGMHPTLLPTGRGRAAIPWAIIKGLPETGVTLFKLDDGVDTGPILAQERIPLAADENASRLYNRVAVAHRLLIRRVWQPLVEGKLVLQPQDDALATTWPGRMPDDGRILASMTALEVDRLVRATTHPYPGAFWEAPDGRLRIWKGAIGSTSVAPAPDHRRIKLAKGVFDAVDYVVEQT
jgi:methionyl-tRNA formyltransferase